MTRGQHVRFSSRWIGKEGRISLNGTLVGSNNHRLPIPTELVVSGRDKPEGQESVFDFSQQNERRREKRKNKLGNYDARKPIATEAKVHFFDALRQEVLQIADLLNHLKHGETHHVPGLAARLRLPLVDTTAEPMPLLQLCAAMYDLPLIVYTIPFPRAMPSADMPYTLGLRIGSEPGAFGNNPVDLDLWMGLTTATVGKLKYSNSTLLSDVGNTVGAHFDADIALTVSFLRKFTVAEPKANIAIDFLGRYVERVAESILPLCRQVLATHDQATGRSSSTNLP